MVPDYSEQAGRLRKRRTGDLAARTSGCEVHESLLLAYRTAVPHHISIDPTLGIAAVKARGSVSLSEFLDYRTELAGHADFTSDLRLLIDLREAEFTPSGDEIRRLTTSSPFSGEALIAVLVPDDLHFGLARMWAVFGERASGTLHPFRSLDEACEWLDVPPGDALRLIT